MIKLISEEKDIRIDKYLASILDYSREFISKLIDHQLVLVNGKVVKASYKVDLNEEIIVHDYRAAPSRDILKWRRKRDSNPCAAFATSRFSRPIPSTGLGYSSIYWCPRPDLNRHELLHSQDFKSCASTYSATRAGTCLIAKTSSL